jgi:predicted kinase
MDLVVVSGWTGSGKSTIAMDLAEELPAAMVSFDWVMSGLRVFDEVWKHVEEPVELQRSVGWSLMGRVIEQQLAVGHSVVADLVARDEVLADWQALAERHHAKFSVIECMCADVAIHRSRVEGRQRNIPGWYELTWDRVERGRTAYPPLTAPKLSLDTGASKSENLIAALNYLLEED